MTKEKIIERLLEDKNITVSEAMLLLANDPIPISIPYIVQNPSRHDTTGNPPNVWCSTQTSNVPAFEYPDTKWPNTEEK